MLRAGLIMLTAVLLFELETRCPEQSARIDVLSLYWHFGGCRVGRCFHGCLCSRSAEEYEWQTLARR